MGATYAQLPSTRRAVIRSAIVTIQKDPKTAEHSYSVPVDPGAGAGWLAIPFLAPESLGSKDRAMWALVWRHDPAGADRVEILDFAERWGDLAMPQIWPRDE